MSSFMTWLFRQPASTVIAVGVLVFLFWMGPGTIDRVLDTLAGQSADFTETIRRIEDNQTEQIKVVAELKNSIDNMKRRDDARWNQLFGGQGIDRILPGWRPNDPWGNPAQSPVGDQQAPE